MLARTPGAPLGTTTQLGAGEGTAGSVRVEVIAQQPLRTMQGTPMPHVGTAMLQEGLGLEAFGLGQQLVVFSGTCSVIVEGVTMLEVTGVMVEVVVGGAGEVVVVDQEVTMEARRARALPLALVAQVGVDSVQR